MTTWTIDHAHTQIGFKVKHLMVSSLRGAFTQFEGSITTSGDSFDTAQATFTAQAASIDTGLEMRDAHLRSAEFFDAEQFPTVTFTSKSFAKKDDATYEVTGDLTMHGITKPVTLTATTEGIGTDIQGRRMVGFEVQGQIKRADFGLVWNKALETGGFAVGEDVWFDLQVELLEVTE